MKKIICIIPLALSAMLSSCTKDGNEPNGIDSSLLLGTWNAVREYSTTLDGTPINDESVEPGVLQWIFDETTLTVNTDGFSQKYSYSFDGKTISAQMALPVEVVSLASPEMTIRMQTPVMDKTGEMQIGYQYVVFNKQ